MSQRLNKLIATVGGVGYLPFAPGTWASAIATIIWFLFSKQTDDQLIWQVVIIIVAIASGIYSSGKVASIENKDPSHIVVDELAGMWLTLLFIPPSFPNYLAGFILFRFFDISKPFGIKRMENYRNGWGIMLDDILAGIYSNILLRIIILSKVW